MESLQSKNLTNIKTISTSVILGGYTVLSTGSQMGVCVVSLITTGLGSYLNKEHLSENRTQFGEMGHHHYDQAWVVGGGLSVDS